MPINNKKMIEKLVKVKEILDLNPKTSRKVWQVESGLTTEEANYLLKDDFIRKRGNTKGAEYFWNTDSPSYAMEDVILTRLKRTNSVTDESEQSKPLSNDATIMDVFKHHNVKFSIGNGMSVRFINNSEVELRKNNGRSIRIDNASKLNELLCFLN